MALARTIDDSPRQMLQRRRLAWSGGQPAQLEGADEEELLQGKMDPTQLQGMEEEEPLQGMKNPAQLRGLDEEEPLQGRMDPAQLQGPEEEELMQGHFESTAATAQRQDSDAAASNSTGMPDSLKTGLESLSGLDLSDVRVNYNSSKPAQLNALAYAQGKTIEVGAGQERHLPHEGWHAVQQMQGRVAPTTEAAGVPVNDDRGLEREADVMGARALEEGAAQRRSSG